MVTTAKPNSDNDKLAEIIQATAAKHDFEVYKTGWSRTTYDVNSRDQRTREITCVAKVESFATTSGHIRLCREEGRAFAEDLGAELEKTFPDIGEAVIVQDIP